MRRRSIVSAIVWATCSAPVALLALGACIDLTPLEITPDVVDAGAPDVLPVDAADGAPDADLRPPCPRCLEKDSGSCQSEFSTCRGDPQCLQIYECAAASGCLDLASVQAVVGCGLPCAQDAGLRSQFDPPGVEILALLQCGQKACQDVCPWARDQ